MKAKRRPNLLKPIGMFILLVALFNCVLMAVAR